MIDLSRNVLNDSTIGARSEPKVAIATAQLDGGEAVPDDVEEPITVVAVLPLVVATAAETI